MENQTSLFDRWLRPLGAAWILLFGPLLIVLSFLGRHGTMFTEEEKHSMTGRLVYAASFVENWFYDMRTTRFYAHEKLSPNIVILEINDESLNKIGRWPWTRSKHAKILDNLRTYGAKVVMFDVVFAEAESDLADQAFVDAINRFTAKDRNSVVLSYGVTDIAEQSVEKLPDFLPMSSLITGTPEKDSMPKQWRPDKFNFVAAKLQGSQASFGFFNAVPDLDGVFRTTQLAQQMDDMYLPSIGFKGFVDFYSDGQEKKVAMETGPGSHKLRILSKQGEFSVPLNAQGELKVRFHGGENTFRRISIDKVLLDPKPESNDELKAVFNGRAVLIGSSALGANDLRHTPVDPLMPGMYMHANLFHALDQNYFYKKDDEGLIVSLALFFLGVGLVLLVSRFKTPLYETVGTVLTVGGLYAADYFYFAPQGYYIRLFFVLNGATWLYAWFTLLNVFNEAREKKRVRDAFSRYVAPEIVKEMLSNPDKMKVGGEKREITMLFSDVRDFTTISERLTAQELSTLLNIYMGKMTDILFDSGGTLDKYIGDAMVGFWGAPLDLPDHAYHAVRGAKLMLEALPEINKEFENRKFPRINVGIGLNTGEASVGNMGSDKIFQYTALGDNMNLASRLESLTKEYGVNLMISEFTLAKLGDKAREFRIRPLDLVQVKGKSKAVKIFEIIPNWSPWTKEDALLEKFHEAYERKYLKKHFEEAKAQFQEVLHTIPEDKATIRLLKKTEEFLKTPPPETWDGVSVFTTK
ncbi:MAG TPA: adenylate/guanylate cyclase domain-containing protein [Bdellovibrionota bacterium]